MYIGNTCVASWYSCFRSWHDDWTRRSRFIP